MKFADNMTGEVPKVPPPTYRRSGVRLAVAALIVVGIAILGWSLRDQLSLAKLAENETLLRDYQQQWPALVMMVAFVTYALVTGLSLPGAAVLTLAFGWYFGLVRGVLLVSFASTLGATLAMLMSRYLVREFAIEKLGAWYSRIDQAFQAEGPYYLFTLRLIPAVPFFVINAVMGLTKIRVWTYWWVSQLGMLPGTLVYVYAGSALPSPKVLQEKGLGSILDPRLAFAFVLLGITPLVLKRVMARFGANSPKTDSADSSTPDVAS